MCRECEDTRDCRCMCVDSDLQSDFYGREFCVICGCRLKEGIKREEPVYEPLLRTL